MRILWLSWRDIKNPQSGGAEKLAFQVCSRLVRDGVKVTLFTSKFAGGKASEVKSGVQILRAGNRLTCRFHAFFHWRAHPDFDLIIDEINTIPAFSIFYARKKVVALIHQLAREYWWSEIFFPVNLIGYLAEPLYLALYRQIPTLTVSTSTKSDLVKLGFSKIKIIREGGDLKPALPRGKSDLILFIGRLTRPKGPQDAIMAFKIINNRLPSTRLLIVGEDARRFTQKLKKLTQKLALVAKVKFAGFVSQKEKISLLKKAKIILIPSVREGWCLVATEANTLGCVPIGYDVPGLRDAIKNNQTGFLTAKNPAALAASAIRVLEDDSLRLKMARGGYHFAQKFSWDNTYRDFTKALVGRSPKAPD